MVRTDFLLHDRDCSRYPAKTHLALGCGKLPSKSIEIETVSRRPLAKPRSTIRASLSFPSDDDKFIVGVVFELDGGRTI